MGRRAIRILDSYAALLVLLLANFFLLEVVDDRRWGVIGSTLLAAAALVVAISDPDTGHTITRRHAISIAICVLIAPVVLVVNSDSIIGLTYLLPAALLVTATLPVTLSRVLRTSGKRVHGGPQRARTPDPAAFSLQTARFVGTTTGAFHDGDRGPLRPAPSGR
jgi:hypothetical protein